MTRTVRRPAAFKAATASPAPGKRTSSAGDVTYSPSAALALIVRGADTDQRDLTPESRGLYALATGFQATSKDDFDNMTRQFPMYDAFYNYCQEQVAAAPKMPRLRRRISRTARYPTSAKYASWQQTLHG